MLLNVLKAKCNLLRIEDTLIRINVRSDAEEMGVDIKWALQRRRAYLDNVVESIQEVMTSLISTNLAGATELELSLIRGYMGEANKTASKYKTQGKLFRTDNKNGITDDMIARAKEYPIKELLSSPVRRNTTHCIAHNDSDPSMGIKNNRVKCFVCGFKGDAIDVAMKINNLDFKSAVKTLIA